jgi:4-hydroxy-4-methyl-2-oxoglutarate aldolase
MHHHVIRAAQRLSGEERSPAIVGPAITIAFAPIASTRAAAEAPYLASRIIERAEAGDVIVVATHGAPHAFWGEHMAQHAHRREVGAAILDGYVRDISGIREIGFPLFARGTTPDTLLPHFEAIGYNKPIVCGDAQVSAGDIIVADSDGVVVIPRRHLTEIAVAVEKRQALEDWAESSATDRSDPFAIYDRIYRDAWDSPPEPPS